MARCGEHGMDLVVLLQCHGEDTCERNTGMQARTPRTYREGREWSQGALLKGRPYYSEVKAAAYCVAQTIF